MPSDQFRFEEFEFDVRSGELRRHRGAEPDEVQRLPPQPARLLALLLSRRGELLGREEIRRELWPDVQVDFDTSLHFCIRQIRTALGDSATEPRFVENLPRRGYRFIPDSRRIDAAEAPRPARTTRRWSFAVVVLAVGTGVLALVLAGLGSNPASDTRLRIGVMPFTAPAEPVGVGGPTPLADRILEELTVMAAERASIVGPTTTVAYAHSDASIAQLAADYELDYVVNGRFIDGPGGPRMLAELIRSSDGAHVWVKGYQGVADAGRVGPEVAGAVLARLGLTD